MSESTLQQRLAEYNAWRRGDETLSQPKPAQIGRDIDEAIECIAELKQIYEDLADHADDGADPDDTSPDDAFAWLHGIIRKRIAMTVEIDDE